MCEIASNLAYPLFHKLFFELMKERNPTVLISLYSEIDKTVISLTGNAAKKYDKKLDGNFTGKFTRQWIKNFAVCSTPGHWRLLKLFNEQTLTFLHLFS